MIFKNKGKLFKAAEKFVLQGRFEQAIAQYLKVVEDDPSDLSTLNIIGDLYTRLGQSQEAIKYYSRVAEQYRTFNYLPKAIAMYKKMEQLAPKNLDIALTLADLYSEEGLKAAAKKQFQQVADRFLALGNDDQAIVALQKIIKLEPDNPQTLASLGQILAARGETLQADRYLMDAGESYLRTGDVTAARATYLRILSVNERQPAALRAVLNTSSTPEQLEDALHRIQALCEKIPDSQIGRDLLGRAHLKLGHFEEAENIFGQLLRDDEDQYFRNFLELALELAKNQRYDQGVQCVEAVSAALLTHRELSLGVAVLERILEAEPQQLAALTLMADLYVKANQEASAGAVLAQLAQALVNLNRFEEALDVAERLQNLSPSNDQHRELHKQIFTQCYPSEPYVSPEQRKARFFEREASLMQATVVSPDQTAARDPVLEYNMLVKYGMFEKAQDLLLDLLRRNSDDSWARDQLKQLEAEGHRPPSKSPVAAGILSKKDSGGLTMPGWMQEAERTTPDKRSAVEREWQPATTRLGGPRAEDAGPRPSENVETFVPRSVRPPAAGPQPTKSAVESSAITGPRSLDWAKAQVASTKPPEPDLAGASATSPVELLKEALSEEGINQAVDSFFKGASEPPSQAEQSSGFDSLFAMGQAQHDMGLHREAIQAFHRALSQVVRFPHSDKFVQCCTYLGLCYLQLGEAQAALPWFQRPFEGKGLDAQQTIALKYEMVRAYEMLGELAQARRELEWIVQVDAGFRDVRQKLKQMEEATR